MIRKPTWFFLALFAVVLAFAWYWTSTQDERQAGLDAQGTPTTGMMQMLFNFDESSIAKVRIERSAGGRVELGRDEAGLWKLVDPAGEIDLAAAEGAVTQLLSLRPVTAIQQAADLSVFGLTRPVHTIVIVLSGGERHTLLVGDVTPTNSGYYVQLDGRSPQVVNTFSLEPIIQLVDNPPLMPAATPTLLVTPEMTGTLSVEATPVFSSTPQP